MATAKKRIAPSLGHTLEQRIATYNRFRETLNPLRGLTIAKAITLLEQYQRGEYADPIWTMLFIEQADMDLFALIERRTSAVTQLNWDIKTSAGEKIDSALADKQKEFLHSVYDRILNLQEAIDFMQMAIFRGFSILQKTNRGVMVNTGATKLSILDQWRFVRDVSQNEWYWNQAGRQTNWRSIGETNKLSPMIDGLIIRECKRNLLRIAMLKYIRSSLSEKDWDSFVEIYGIPSAIIIGPPDVPESKSAEYKTAAEQAAAGGSGYLPNGSDVKYSTDAAGQAPFKARLDHLSEKLILAGTGGMLTMLTQSGSGTLAGEAHQNTFDIIARSDAKDISEVFQKYIDAPELMQAFPGQPVLAYWQLSPIEKKDVTEIATHYSVFKAAGLEIDIEQMKDITGYELKPAPLPVQQPSNFAAQNFNGMNNRAIEGTELDDKPLFKALSVDLKPLRSRIENILTIENEDEFRNALSSLQADLPKMIGMTKATEDMLMKMMSAAWASGIENGQRKDEVK